MDTRTGEPYLEVFLKGVELEDDGFLNKGTCFSLEERRLFELEAHLPPGVVSPEQQEERTYSNYLSTVGDIERYLFLTALQDRNETLFYRLLGNHIEEMAPIVYTPTVGKVCERYSQIFRRPRGAYISPLHRGRIAEVLRDVPVNECQVIVMTDNESILGLGDLGVGGMGIPLGKLTLYTAGAGIHPASCLAIDFDVGTDNVALRENPQYLGFPHPRVRGEEYVSLLDELVEAIGHLFPDALVQWEDFSSSNAFMILERYRKKILSFNDDIQGTGATVVAGILAALARVERKLADERIVFLGVGAAGGGCALETRVAMRAAGASESEVNRRVLAIDSRGLILNDRPGLSGYKKKVATDPNVVEGWKTNSDGKFDLLEVVKNFKPTILIGMSGQAGSFNEEIVRAMHRGCARPIILPLSNPTSHAEAVPEDLIRWTEGSCVVATGSPFAPVVYKGSTFQIGQANNVLIFPGVGLGAVAVGAKWIPNETFVAAAQVLADIGDDNLDSCAPLFPSLRDLRRVSAAVAKAVGESLVASGAAPSMEKDEINRRIKAFVWEPEYLPYRPGWGS